jgi:hypothetical protein
VPANLQSQRWNTASADAPATSGALNPKEFTAFKVAGMKYEQEATEGVQGVA